jgi:hypothetical protein
MLSPTSTRIWRAVRGLSLSSEVRVIGSALISVAQRYDEPPRLGEAGSAVWFGSFLFELIESLCELW